MARVMISGDRTFSSTVGGQAIITARPGPQRGAGGEGAAPSRPSEPPTTAPTRPTTCGRSGGGGQWRVALLAQPHLGFDVRQTDVRHRHRAAQVGAGADQVPDPVAVEGDRGIGDQRSGRRLTCRGVQPGGHVHGQTRGSGTPAGQVGQGPAEPCPEQGVDHQVGGSPIVPRPEPHALARRESMGPPGRSASAARSAGRRRPRRPARPGSGRPRSRRPRCSRDLPGTATRLPYPAPSRTRRQRHRQTGALQQHPRVRRGEGVLAAGLLRGETARISRTRYQRVRAVSTRTGGIGFDSLTADPDGAVPAELLTSRMLGVKDSLMLIFVHRSTYDTGPGVSPVSR